MQIDIFREILVPVIGGLGIFMLGLEFMSDGIQNLAVNRMRSLLGKIAGTPVKGLLAGTMITGVLQSSTAMTVMVVGLVNAGVIALRPAISVIMGANIGTTLGNGLIALPLGPLGLILAGTFALVYVFSKSAKTRNIALSAMGLSLIFYGLNLLTGGLKPLRAMPEVMEAISSLNADTFGGLLACVLTAAGITAMIHSSSATIGIVMGLGAAGVLDWQTAVAFSLGADLGTTITSWMASLNLSKHAKRAAYAHISFNFIGVIMMLPLFYVSMDLLVWVMGLFGAGDPGAAVMVDGKETFPLVPIAVGIYSTCFNIFNTAVLFPFIGVFERVLSRIGHTAADDDEDFALPRYLDRNKAGHITTAVPAVQSELGRYVLGTRQFLAAARGEDKSPENLELHGVALDTLNQEIRRYTAGLLKPNMPYAQADLLASLIEEEDFTATLGQTLHQIARRIHRQPMGQEAQGMVKDVLARIESDLEALDKGRYLADGSDHSAPLAAMRKRALEDPEMSWEDRGAVLALLGSAERTFFLIGRIAAERKSVSRDIQRFGNTRPVRDDGLTLAPGAA